MRIEFRLRACLVCGKKLEGSRTNLRKIRGWWSNGSSGGCWGLVEERGEGRRDINLLP